jgi:alpha-mannosidase
VEREVAVLLGGTEDAAGDGVGIANAAPFALAGVVDTHEGPSWAEAPPHGIGTVSRGLPAGVAPARIDGDAHHVVLANGLVSVAIAPDGTLASVHDHRVDREVLAGPGNVLQVFRDLPNTYDAWDVDQHTLRLAPEVLTDVEHLEVVEQTEMRVAVRVRRAFGASTIEQTYVLRAGSPRLDIVTDVDWQERERLLKAAFPFDLRADEARYEVQYGHVRRPTHRNTSWDAARFEVCAHTWADVSEPGFGAAVLNDAKYGHDCVGDSTSTTMRLTLLRAARYPDPEADCGRHRFTYSLLPHDGTLREVLPEAWALNVPPRVVAAAPAPSVAAVDHSGVVVTAVKAADDGSGDLVVRLHEALGGRARTTLRTASAWSTATTCDLLERPTGEPAPAADGVALELRPFEVRTVRLSR